MAMYTNTLTLIKKHPLFGGGTGSLEGEYKPLAQNQNSDLIRVANPHNQYLLTTQEIGIVGLVCLLWMWMSHWQTSYKTTRNEYGYGLRGLVITITVGSLFNSLLLDASEGKFYCVLAGIFLSSCIPKTTSTIQKTTNY